MCIDDNSEDNGLYNWWFSNNPNNWTYFTTNWGSTGVSTTWITCPNCNNLVEWSYKYCGHCGYQIIADPPSNQDIIDRLDKMIKELNELKAKLIKK